jgi:hypothetical protein
VENIDIHYNKKGVAMIIAQLNGGLGNQMFQYALGRHLAQKQYSELKLDLSYIERGKYRPYSLHCFNIQEQIANRTDINFFMREKYLTKFKKLSYVLLRKIGYQNKINSLLDKGEIIIEEFGNVSKYNPNIINKTGSLYLMGYWQTEKYFSPIRNLLLKEFTIKYPQDSKNKQLSEIIQACNSVSVHVRRGDYISNSDYFQFHGVCSIDYYIKAVNYIAGLIDNPHFFIFSDDPIWTKSNINIPYPTHFMDHNANQDYDDLRLMSQCRHNIIANSSFSWWGAWLNQNPNKVVCAPKKWYKNENINTNDLVPLDWVRL